jgi:hypothetical protein
VRARILLAAAGVVLAALVAGAAGAVVVAAVVVTVAGFGLRSEYAAAPPAVVELPDPAPRPSSTPRRFEEISGQLSIGMSDGRYYDRAVRPLLLRIARTTVAARGRGDVDAAILGAGAGRRPPTLRELSRVLDRMEQL